MKWTQYLWKFYLHQDFQMPTFICGSYSWLPEKEDTAPAVESILWPMEQWKGHGEKGTIISGGNSEQMSMEIVHTEHRALHGNTIFTLNILRVSTFRIHERTMAQGQLKFYLFIFKDSTKPRKFPGMFHNIYKHVIKQNLWALLDIIDENISWWSKLQEKFKVGLFTMVLELTIVFHLLALFVNDLSFSVTFADLAPSFWPPKRSRCQGHFYPPFSSMLSSLGSL